VHGVPFIDPDEFRILAVRSPGLLATVFGPADWNETPNAAGLPRYSKQYPSSGDDGVHLDVQMKAMSYCRRPKVLVDGFYGTGTI
jgi:hypothetical protein